MDEKMEEIKKYRRNKLLSINSYSPVQQTDRKLLNNKDCLV